MISAVRIRIRSQPLFARIAVPCGFGKEEFSKIWMPAPFRVPSVTRLPAKFDIRAAPDGSRQVPARWVDRSALSSTAPYRPPITATRPHGIAAAAKTLYGLVEGANKPQSVHPEFGCVPGRARGASCDATFPWW